MKHKTEVRVFDPNGNDFHHAYSDLSVKACAAHYAKGYQGKVCRSPDGVVGVIDEHNYWLYMFIES